MLFIRSSLKTEVQAVYTRKSFFYQIIFIPQGLILVHFVLNYQLFMDENYKKAPIMLQKACMDPYQEFHVPLYNIFRADQFLLACYNYLCFYGNLSLFRTLMNNFRNIIKIIIWMVHPQNKTAVVFIHSNYNLKLTIEYGK